MPQHRNTKHSKRSINDIRKPEVNPSLLENWFPKAEFSNIHVPRSDRGVKILAVCGAVIIVAVILAGGYLFILRSEAVRSTNLIFESLSNIVYGPFSSSNSGGSSQVASQKSVSSQYGVNLLTEIPFLENIPSGFSDITNFANLIIQTQISLAQLRATGLNLFLSANGSGLLTQLSTVGTDLKNLGSLGESIRNWSAQYNAIDPVTATNFFSTGADLQRETQALNSLISLLQEPNSNVLVLFENTNMERPGGGSIVAYADAEISDGSLAGFTVKNITSLQPYDQKIVPPLQLQTIEASWKLRDSDWFTDFPTSAAGIMSRVENAEQAEGTTTQYSAVIAASPQVIQDLVDVLGPIQLPDGKSLTAVNFNALTNQLGYVPFLNQLLPALQERALDFSSSERANLLQVSSNWISNRDVRVYFTDPNLEALINEYNAGGQTYQIPPGYVGDYLSVVHTDIIGNGDNAADSLSLHSEIQPDGTIDNDLDITRENGSNSLNQEYFQVVVPSGSKLISIIGNTHNTVTAPTNYKQSDYVEDPEIVAIESTREVDPDSLAESYTIAGNTVFGFWLTLDPGVTGTVSVTYDSPQIPLTNGENYQFVIERQPGENANLIYSVQAPDGWQWQQANNVNYLYSSEGLPGRTVLDINLEK